MFLASCRRARAVVKNMLLDKTSNALFTLLLEDGLGNISG